MTVCSLLLAHRYVKLMSDSATLQEAALANADKQTSEAELHTVKDADIDRQHVKVGDNGAIAGAAATVPLTPEEDGKEAEIEKGLQRTITPDEPYFPVCAASHA